MTKTTKSERINNKRKRDGLAGVRKFTTAVLITISSTISPSSTTMIASDNEALKMVGKAQSEALPSHVIVPIYLDGNKNMYIKLDVGTPPKTLKMQIDLGSSLMTITTTQTNVDAPQNRDSRPLFECSESKTCKNLQTQKSELTTFGDVQGPLVSDTIVLTDLPSIKITNFTFLSASNAPEDLLESGFDGIVGLGRMEKLNALNLNLPPKAQIKSFYNEMKLQNYKIVQHDKFTIIAPRPNIKNNQHYIAFGAGLSEFLSEEPQEMNITFIPDSWNLQAYETFIGDTQIMLQGEIYTIVLDNTLQGMFGDYEIINRMMDYQELPYEVSCQAKVSDLKFSFYNPIKKPSVNNTFSANYTSEVIKVKSIRNPNGCRIDFTPIVFPTQTPPMTQYDIANHVIRKTLILGNVFLLQLNIEFDEENDVIRLI